MSSRDNARRFHFLREIASGGFGSVYLAKVMHSDGFSRLVAVKLLKSQWSDSEEVARRMRDEARLLGLLRHRNIVDVIDLTAIDGRAAVIMEYLEAVDLRFVTVRLGEMGEQIPVKAALEICAAIASALDAAFNRPPIPGDKPLRVVHRDIKPSNVMVDENGVVKVLDFGVARSELADRESHTQDLQFGSVDYMAPERLFFEPESHSSDIYSLGATFFELLALEKLGKAKGRHEKHALFLADRLSFLRSRVSLRGTAATEVESLLKASLDFDQEKRPTAAEFYQRCRALSRLVDDEDLPGWAERTLAPLIHEAASVPQIPTPMTDSVRMEDSVLFRPGQLGPGADSDGRQIPGAWRGPADLGVPLPSALAGSELPPVGAEHAAAGVERTPAAAEHTPAAAESGELVDPPGVADPSDWEDGPTTAGVPGGRPIRRAPAEEPLPAQPPADLPADPAEPFAGLDALRSPVRAAPMSPPTGAPRPVAPRSSSPTLIPDYTDDLPTTTSIDAQMVAEAKSRAAASNAEDDAATVLMTAEMGGEVRVVQAPARPAVAAPLRESADRTNAQPTEAPGPGAPPPAVARAAAARPASGRGLAVASVGSGDLGAEPDLASPRPKSRVGLFAALGCFVLLLGGAAVGGGLWLLRAELSSLVRDLGAATAPADGSAEHAPKAGAPAAEAQPVASPGAEAAPEAAPAGPVIRFRSAEPNTTKINVRCDAANAKGTTEAVVGAASAKTCTVTAILSDRSRLSAVVTGPTEGSYRCFADGAKDCLRQ